MRLRVIIISVALIIGFCAQPFSYTLEAGTVYASSTSPYYQSGDTVEYSNPLIHPSISTTYVAAPQGAGIDILRLTSQGTLSVVSRVVSQGTPFSAAFAYDNSNLILIVASGKYLEQFSLNDVSHPVLQRVQEFPGYYFYQVSHVGGIPEYVIVNSTRGAEVRLAHDFSLVRNLAYDSAWGASWTRGGYIPINMRTSLVLSSQDGVHISWTDIPAPAHIGVPYASQSFGFFPTDQGLVRLDAQGRTIIYRPKTRQGYAVLGSSDGSTVYFANGWGVIKLDKDLRYLKSAQLSGSGMWAAGMQWATVGTKKYIVVFNGSGVRVIDENLKTYSIYIGSAFTPTLTRAARFSVRVDGSLQIVGTGFYPGEEIVARVDGAVREHGYADNIGTVIFASVGQKGRVAHISGSISGRTYESTIW